jgi:hypothetical protein
LNCRHRHCHSHLLGKLFGKKHHHQADCCADGCSANGCTSGCDNGHSYSSGSDANGGTSSSLPDIQLPDDTGPAPDPLPSEPAVPPAPPIQPAAAEIESDSGGSALRWLHPQLRRLFRN